MKPNPEDLPRIRAVFLLSKFTAAVQSDVLSDGTIAARFQIPVSQPVQLFDDLTFDRTLLFDAFRKATDGLPLPALVDIDGKPTGITITIQDDAAVIVRDTKRSVFPFAARMSSDLERRLSVLKRALAHHSLAIAERTGLENLLRRPDYSDRDFMAAVKLLATSPESFATALRDKVSRGAFALPDLLPASVEYWSNLSAPYRDSTTLQDFIASELADEQTVAVRENPVRAFLTMSLSFGSPSLIPRELIKDVPGDVMLSAVERVERVDDPFALCGALDICADRAPADTRFAPAGARILQKLFGDMKRLEMACDIFGAIFVIATAHLAEHETLRHRPVYWRRIAAVSHAALVLRTLGIGNNESDPLLPWAYRWKGQTYYLSVFNEFFDQCRWRPDWIEPRFLVADIYGRTLGARLRLSGQAPPGWQEPIDKARAWVEEKKLQFAAYFPAVLEGGRRSQAPKLEELTQSAGADVAGLVTRLMDNPSIDNFLILGPIIHSFDLPPEASDAVFQLVTSVRSNSSNVQPQIFHAVMSLASDIAAQNLDPRLADFVADSLIENAVDHNEPKSFLETVFKLLECAAANPDRNLARVALARRLESLAYLIPPTGLAQLSNLLKTLQSLDGELAPHLGRAVAIARLGRPQAAA